MAHDARIVLAAGAFDLFHAGHLAYLQTARGYGDELVVAVTSDEWVRRHKGRPRPIFPLVERLAMLEALKVVSRVVISEADDMVDTIRRVKPAVYVKGADYLDGDPSGRLDRERQAVEALGGRLVILDAWPQYSSTAIMRALA